MSLPAELIARIREAGPMALSEYMARCNTHYYATRDPFGRRGDFITAPEISQIFGELIGVWAAQYWQDNAMPQALLCEMGPGRGTLMRDALRATKKVPGFHDSIAIRMIETSPQLRTAQQAALSSAHPRISWHETLEDIPHFPLLLIANEFFDALPIDQLVAGEEGTNVRRIDHDGERFHFVGRDQVTGEVSPASRRVMQSIGKHISSYGGAALIIDYGYGTGQGDTFQAVRYNRHADPLQDPGEADLTAHVDFAALAEAARIGGAYVHGPIEQGLFLKRLGAELRATALCRQARPEQCDAILSGLERLVSPAEMGTLFKVMAITSSLERPAGF